MKFLILAALISIPGYAQTSKPEQALQNCFNNIGRSNFKVIAYSEDTKTLYYEVNKRQSVILRARDGYESSTEPGATCKPISGGDFEKLAQQLEKGVLDRTRSHSASQLQPCADSVRFLGFPAIASHLESVLKGAPATNPPAPPAIKVE